MKRLWLWLLLGFVIMGTIGTGFLVIGRARARPEQAEELPPPPSPKEEALGKIKMAVTSGLAMPPDRVELDEVNETEKGWFVRVEAKSKDIKVSSVLDDAQKVFGELKRTGVPVAGAAITLRSDQLRDVYGRSLPKEPIARIDLSGEVFNKIKWSGFDPVDFPKVAEVFWLHSDLEPEMKKMQEAKEKQPQQQQSSASAGEGGSES